MKELWSALNQIPQASSCSSLSREQIQMLADLSGAGSANLVLQQRGHWQEIDPSAPILPTMWLWQTVPHDHFEPPAIVAAVSQDEAAKLSRCRQIAPYRRPINYLSARPVECILFGSTK
ncbi:MAG: hypothetical protein AAGI34_17495 [Pseudomonadota bacterium]